MKEEKKVAALFRRGLGSLFGGSEPANEYIKPEAENFEISVEKTPENYYEDIHKKEGKMAKHKNKGKMSLRSIKPITFTQETVFKAFVQGMNIMMHGIAGTGKTYIAMYLALKECERYSLQYHKVYIVRSGVPTRDLGYLPGSVKEKAAVYESPYEQIVNKLYDRGDAYEICKAHGEIEFLTTSFLRGVTFENCIVIVDEIQNMSYGELATIITRSGDNCRFIFCGDFRQTDLFRSAEKAGLQHFMNIVKRMPQFSFHEFNIADIVRSDMVRSFLVEESEYRDRNSEFNN